MRGTESPPSTCWPHFRLCITGYICVFGLQAYSADTCPIFHPPVPPSPPSSAGLYLLMPQFVSMFGIAPALVQDLVHGLVELHGALTGPPFSPSGLLWMASLPSSVVGHTTKQHVIHKLVDGALTPCLCH